MRTFEAINKKKFPEPRPKLCKHCGTQFFPRTTFQSWCQPDCAIEIAKKKKQKAFQKQCATEKKVWQMTSEKVSYFEKALEREINAIARCIDYGLNCISCDPNTPIKKMFAGHYHSVGSNCTLRFNLHNIHRQCYSCNGNKGGNQNAYLYGLKWQYGSMYAGYVQYEIVRDYKLIKWSREQLVEWTKTAKKIRKSLESNPITRTLEQRIELRSEINKELGIYTNNFK